MNRDLINTDSYELFKEIVNNASICINRFEVSDTDIFIYYDYDLYHSMNYINNLIMQFDFKLREITNDSIILQDRYNAKIRVYFIPYNGLDEDEYSLFNTLLKEACYCLQGKLEENRR